MTVRKINKYPLLVNREDLEQWHPQRTKYCTCSHFPPFQSVLSYYMCRLFIVLLVENSEKTYPVNGWFIELMTMIHSLSDSEKQWNEWFKSMNLAYVRHSVLFNNNIYFFSNFSAIWEYKIKENMLDIYRFLSMSASDSAMFNQY